MKRFKAVDDYINSSEYWREGLVKLRTILNDTELEETVKWGGPCYTLDGKNVVGLGAFKSYVGLWFYQGALLGDEDKVLINAQEGKTRGLRQLRFESEKAIKVRLVRRYVAEAIALQKSGKVIEAERSKPLVIPPELGKALRDNKEAGVCFKKLTKGKQREYAEYIQDAKRAETKATRLLKIIPMIREMRGLNDKYRPSK